MWYLPKVWVEGPADKSEWRRCSMKNLRAPTLDHTFDGELNFRQGLDHALTHRVHHGTWWGFTVMLMIHFQSGKFGHWTSWCRLLSRLLNEEQLSLSFGRNTGEYFHSSYFFSKYFKMNVRPNLCTEITNKQLIWTQCKVEKILHFLEGGDNLTQQNR